MISGTRVWSIDVICFVKRRQLEVLATEEIVLHMNMQDKEATIKVTLKELLWIYELPCRLVSTATICGLRYEGEDFVLKRRADEPPCRTNS